MFYTCKIYRNIVVLSCLHS